MKKECFDVLIVEDDDAINDSLRFCLENMGYTVQQALHGEEAMSWLYQATFKLVLLDMLMPVMDGFTVLENMSRSELLSTLPVIAMSASLRFRKSPFPKHVTFMPKPMDLDALEKIVNQAVGQEKEAPTMIHPHRLHFAFSS